MHLPLTRGNLGMACKNKFFTPNFAKISRDALALQDGGSRGIQPDPMQTLNPGAFDPGNILRKLFVYFLTQIKIQTLNL